MEEIVELVEEADAEMVAGEVGRDAEAGIARVAEGEGGGEVEMAAVEQGVQAEEAGEEVMRAVEAEEEI